MKTASEEARWTGGVVHELQEDIAHAAYTERQRNAQDGSINNEIRTYQSKYVTNQALNVT